MTDPSYAAQIVTFTFPHIGNVGANYEDLEADNPFALGCVVRAGRDRAEQFPRRAGLRRVDARERADRAVRRRHAGADPARSGIDGAPNGVIAHRADGEFDVDALLAKARAWPGLEGMDLAKEVSCRQMFRWSGGAGGSARAMRSARMTRRCPHVVAIDYGSKRNIFRNLADAGARVTVLPATATLRRGDGARAGRLLPLQRPRRSRRDRRLCGAGDPADAGDRQAAVRHLPRPPVARPRGRRDDREDAPGPSRRQPSGQAPRRRPGRDHQHEPRLRGRGATACPPMPARPMSACSTAASAGWS